MSKRKTVKKTTRQARVEASFNRLTPQQKDAALALRDAVQRLSGEKYGDCALGDALRAAAIWLQGIESANRWEEDRKKLYQECNEKRAELDRLLAEEQGLKQAHQAYAALVNSVNEDIVAQQEGALGVMVWKDGSVYHAGRFLLPRPAVSKLPMRGPWGFVEVQHEPCDYRKPVAIKITDSFYSIATALSKLEKKE